MSLTQYQATRVRVGQAHRVLKGGALCLICAAWSISAWAEGDGPLSVDASYAVLADSNLFKTPTAQSEQIGISSLALNFKTQQSLQELELQASVVDYRYQQFNYLGFVATNYNAAWRWAVTPSWTGNLRTSRKETLDDFARTVGSTQRNVRLETNTRVDAMYAIDGPWRLLAGLSTARLANEQTLIAGQEYNSTSADVGLQHAFASGSTLTYKAALSNGSYVNPVVLPGAQLDGTYKQLDNDFRMHWIVSGLSIVDAYATFINRQHPNFPQRDFTGLNTGATLRWELTGKSTLIAGYSRSIAAYATADTNYSQTDRVSIGPVWQISPKTSLSFQHQWSEVTYLGTPTPGLSNARKDVTRDSSLAFTWLPSRHWSFTTMLQSLARDSNVAAAMYSSNLLSVVARFTF